MTLLLVEDDHADARLVTEFLIRSRFFEHEVVRAASQAEALALGEDRTFDLVILDYWLRTEASLPLNRSWAATFPGAPILLVTSVDASDIQALALSCGATGYLHKNDLSPSALDAVIRTMLHACESERKLRETLAGQPGEPNAARAAAHDETAHGKSREVLSTLNAMHGFARLLSTDSRDVLPGMDTAGYIDLLKQGSDTLVDILRSYLSRATSADGAPKLVFQRADIGKIIKSAALTVQHQCHDRGHTLLESTIGGPVQAEVDKAAIYQMLLILLTNAVKRSPRESTITIVLTDMGERCKVAVSDQGVGMTKEEAASALARSARILTTAEIVQPGPGQGLAVVASIAELHRGSVDIESTKGWGTTVEVTLPVKRARLN
jgi:signal transduction histidine kinase